MTLKQAIKDPSWLLERMSNQKVEGNDGPGFRHVRCPKMLWEELVKLVEGLKVEEGRDGVTISLRDFMEGLAKLCRTSMHPDTAVREQLGSVAGLIEGALAAQHLKREQELEITAAQAEVLDAILAEHTTDSVDYELAADDMGAALFGGVGKWAGKALLTAAQPPQELVSLDHKELANFFWRHAPVLWKDRWTCRCGKWALSRELNSVEQADESRSQHVAEAFLEWRAALTRGAVGYTPCFGCSRTSPRVASEYMS